MEKITIQLDNELIDFIDKFSEYGFKSKDELICKAISGFQEKVTDLIESALLYRSIYINDAELQELTEFALNDVMG